MYNNTIQLHHKSAGNHGTFIYSNQNHTWLKITAYTSRVHIMIIPPHIKIKSFDFCSQERLRNALHTTTLKKSVHKARICKELRRHSSTCEQYVDLIDNPVISVYIQQAHGHATLILFTYKSEDRKLVNATDWSTEACLSSFESRANNIDAIWECCFGSKYPSGKNNDGWEHKKKTRLNHCLVSWNWPFPSERSWKIEWSERESLLSLQKILWLCYVYYFYVRLFFCYVIVIFSTENVFAWVENLTSWC